MLQQIIITLLLIGALSFLGLRLYRRFKKQGSCDSCAIHKAQTKQ